MPGFGVRVRHINDSWHVCDSRMELFALFSLQGYCRIGHGAMQRENAKHDAHQRR